MNNNDKIQTFNYLKKQTIRESKTLNRSGFPQLGSFMRQGFQTQDYRDNGLKNIQVDNGAGVFFAPLTAQTSTRDKDRIFPTQEIDLDAISLQQQNFKQRQNITASLHMRVPQTQRAERPPSRVNFKENGNTVTDDLIGFEEKIRNESRFAPQSKYPNIELKRCFDAKNFRESNHHITRLASTRAGTMRSYVQTTEPRKRMSSQRHEYLATRKNTFEAEEDLEESESHY